MYTAYTGVLQCRQHILECYSVYSIYWSATVLECTIFIHCHIQCVHSQSDPHNTNTADFEVLGENEINVMHQRVSEVMEGFHSQTPCKTSKQAFTLGGFRSTWKYLHSFRS